MDLRSVYQKLCRFYPAEHRRVFETEMLHTFESAAAESRLRGPRAFTRFVVAELAGLLLGAVTEWSLRLTRRSPTRQLRSAGAERIAANELADTEKEIAAIIDRMIHAIANHDFPAARAYSCQERAAREKLRRAFAGQDQTPRNSAS